VKVSVAQRIILTLLMLPACASGGRADTVKSTTPIPVPGLKTVVLSPANFTDDTRSYDLTVEAIYTNLRNLKIEVVDSHQLRPILRRHRIRSAGRIAPADAAIIKQETGSDLLLTGSVDFCRRGENPEFGLSLRLVSPNDMIVCSAVSHAATAGGYGLFGTGRIGNADSLTVKVVAQAVTELYAPLLWPEAVIVDSSSPRIVVLPFENIADNRQAGFIVANSMLAELVDRGFSVLEPGAAYEQTVSLGFPVGAIDYQQLARLHQTLQVDFVITGQVDRFTSARGGSPSSKPEFGFGARMIDAASGRILAVHSAELDGAETEVAFGLGRCYTLGGLLRRAFKDTMKRFQSRIIENEHKQTP